MKLVEADKDAAFIHMTALLHEASKQLTTSGRAPTVFNAAPLALGERFRSGEKIQPVTIMVIKNQQKKNCRPESGF